MYPVSRREFLAGSAALAASTMISQSLSAAEATAKPPVVLFTKHLPGTSYVELAETLVELGFDGADLTVRPKGHVLPENVKSDLPKAVEAIRKAGLEVYMITTGISGPDDPTTEPILRTAAGLGIKFYRIGDFGYDAKRPVLDQLKQWNESFKRLAELNEKYGIAAGYHNHSGLGRIGGPIWDLHTMLEGVDPKWVGSNYDIGHAVLEGSGGAWETNFRLIAPRIKMSAIKDCAWNKTEKGWKTDWVPMGEGIVKWPRALSLMKGIGFTGPFSIHIEYATETGSTPEEKKKSHHAALKHDLDALRGFMKEVGWV